MDTGPPWPDLRENTQRNSRNEPDDSAESVGALAQRSGAKRLVLSHLLPPPTGLEDELLFIEDARGGGYQGPIDVARDRLRIEVLVDEDSAPLDGS